MSEVHRLADRPPSRTALRAATRAPLMTPTTRKRVLRGGLGLLAISSVVGVLVLLYSPAGRRWQWQYHKAEYLAAARAIVKAEGYCETCESGRRLQVATAYVPTDAELLAPDFDPVRVLVKPAPAPPVDPLDCGSFPVRGKCKQCGRMGEPEQTEDLDS